MTEELLTQMIREACEREFEEIEKRILEEHPHIFSDEFEQKMDEMIGQPEWESEDLLPAKRKFHFRLRYALVAVLLLILGSSTVMGSDFLKEQMKRIAYTVFPEYVRIESPEQTETSDTDSYTWKEPSYVPEGYHMTKNETYEEFGNHTVAWCNEDDEIISYMQVGVNSTVALTSNGEKPKDVKIGDITGKLSVDEGGNHSLFFEDGEEIFTIVGPISEEEIVRMAESIQ